ncbi:MAG: hypothetical protein QOE21_948, partial [Microbacteriaceae bacterium]|nr:hypothetical protein [Microbacteriaceae bacterium]
MVGRGSKAHGSDGRADGAKRDRRDIRSLAHPRPDGTTGADEFGAGRFGAEHFGSGLFDEAAQRDANLPDIDWSVLPDGASGTRLDAPSGSLAVVTMGDPANPRVLLAPGVTGSKEDFSLMMPELAAAGYYVVSYDLAGQYESADAGPEHLVPPRAHDDYDLFVDDMIAMLEWCGGVANVLGYSYAATVAQIALERRPEL